MVVGILLGKAGCPVQALSPSVATSLRGHSAAPSWALQRARGRACVRRRPGDMSLSAAGGSGGAGDIDSSELYADMRRRLEELRRGSTDDSTQTAVAEDVSDLGLTQQQEDGRDDSGAPGGGGNAGGAGAKMYSAQEMKQRYYEAFWRARNLHKEAKFAGGASDAIQQDSSETSSSAPTPPPETQTQQSQAPASRTTTLTPMAMNMFLSGKASAEADPVAPSSSSDNVQGLTQMYYLAEEDEPAADAAATTTTAVSSSQAPAQEASAAAGTVAFSLGKRREWEPSPRQTDASLQNEAALSSTNREPAAAGGGDLSPSSGGTVTSMSAEPQGLTQAFYLDPGSEANAVAALPVVPRRSFLRERLGVPGEVVQDLRQVELDHARLAMVAVLMSGAVGAGAGAGAGVYLNAHDGFSALAEVARTPWLDPYVAGGILAAKALSEGDWRIGKGAMAGWADRALSSLSNTGAKVLRVGSGNELRRLAVEIEVKHGRLALGAVVCAMAQQGIFTVAA
eukprot:g3165.t1